MTDKKDQKDHTTPSSARVCGKGTGRGEEAHRRTLGLHSATSCVDLCNEIIAEE